MTGIVILNYNNPQITIDCFESIEKINSAPCKYVVVDNASTDDSVQILDRYFSAKSNFKYHKYNETESVPDRMPPISVVVARNNYGYARGNNIGCRFLEKDSDIRYIMILNNDTIFIQDILPQMSKFLCEHKDAAIISPLLQENDEGKIKYNSARENRTIGELFAFYSHFSPAIKYYNKKHQILLNNPQLLNDNFVEIDVPTGACMMLRKDIFKRLGYFDPNTFLYYEENILSKKVERIKMKKYVLPQQKLIHLGQTTTKKTNFNYYQERKKSWSCYYYGMRYSGMSIFLKPLFFLFYCYHISIISLKFILVSHFIVKSSQ